MCVENNKNIKNVCFFFKKYSELTPVWGHPPEHGQFASSDSTTKSGSPYSSSHQVPLFVSTWYPVPLFFPFKNF